MTKPSRHGVRWRREEDEAIADVYIAHGPGGGGAAVLRPLAGRLERTEASMRMPLSNLRAVVEGGGVPDRQFRKAIDRLSVASAAPWIPRSGTPRICRCSSVPTVRSE